MTNNSFELKDKNILLEEIKDFYTKEVLPILPEYEARRKEDKFTILLILGIPACFGLSAINPIFIIGFIVLILISMTRKGVVINGNYESKIKSNLMPKFLSIFGNYKWYKFSARLTNVIQNLKKLKIFPDAFMLMLDDTIMGSYKGIGINIFEIRTGVYANSWVLLLFIVPLATFITILPIGFFCFVIISLSKTFHFPEGLTFILLVLNVISFPILFVSFIYKACLKQSLKGVIVEYTFPKNFKKETIVYEKAMSSQKLINKYQNQYEKVVLEDTEFNKNYTVYSNDQVESRYLLTTSFIERFKEVNLAFEPDFQRAEFKNNKLYILIKTKKDLFKFGCLSKETTYEDFASSGRELYSLISLADHLKLDQKIGL